MKAAVVGTGLIATQKHLPAWQRIGEKAPLSGLRGLSPMTSRMID
jgi:hypothetical protein